MRQLKGLALYLLATPGCRFRLLLRLLNSKLGLGLNVPLVDTATGGVTHFVKEKTLTEQGAIAMNTIQGLALFTDGKHFEIRAEPGPLATQ